MTITTTQREAALRLIDELSRPHCDLGQQEAAALLRELLAEPPAWSGDPSTQDYASTQRELAAAPQGEPVAWCCLTPSGKIAYSDGKPMVMPGPVGNEVHRTPLYAHPQQRKPLTKVQITELAEQCGYDGAVPTVRLAFQGFRLDDFAHAVERAHGIGETP